MLRLVHITALVQNVLIESEPVNLPGYYYNEAPCVSHLHLKV